MSETAATPLVSWTLSFMRPYRGRMTLVAVLLLLEVALGALQPWLLKIVTDPSESQGLPGVGFPIARLNDFRVKH